MKTARHSTRHVIDRKDEKLHAASVVLFCRLVLCISWCDSCFFCVDDSKHWKCIVAVRISICHLFSSFSFRFVSFSSAFIFYTFHRTRIKNRTLATVKNELASNAFFRINSMRHFKSRAQNVVVIKLTAQDCRYFARRLNLSAAKWNENEEEKYLCCCCNYRSIELAFAKQMQRTNMKETRIECCESNRNQKLLPISSFLDFFVRSFFRFVSY